MRRALKKAEQKKVAAALSTKCVPEAELQTALDKLSADLAPLYVYSRKDEYGRHIWWSKELSDKITVTVRTESGMSNGAIVRNNTLQCTSEALEDIRIAESRKTNRFFNSLDR